MRRTLRTRLRTHDRFGNASDAVEYHRRHELMALAFGATKATTDHRYCKSGNPGADGGTVEFELDACNTA